MRVSDGQNIAAVAISEFAPAKINLALHVLGRRDDGYHELDSIVAFADVGDALTIRPAEKFSIAATGPFAAQLPKPEDNIMHRAWQLAREIAGERGRALPPVAIDLVKNLPVASGIGGGSADAAAVLRGCMKLAGIELDDGLVAAALSLGADVPICLAGRSARMRGVGEDIAVIGDFVPLAAVLVNPGIGVATSDVFTGIGLQRGQSHRPAIVPSEPLARLRNDMQDVAIAVAPVIKNMLAALSAQPSCTFARMSGSGATCFGIFEEEGPARAAAAAIVRENPTWWVKPIVVG